MTAQMHPGKKRDTRRAGLAVCGLLAAALVAPALHAQAGGEAEQEFLRAAGEHFGMPASEVAVLSRWRLASAEIPVVLFVARRAGVSPDVVVAQRRRGSDWMAISAGYALHAGDFHVPIDGSPGPLADAYARFEALPASQWREVTLTDNEVIGFVNVGFLSRFLGVSAGAVAREMGGAGGMAGVFRRLGGGPAPAGVAHCGHWRSLERVPGLPGSGG